MAVAAVTKAIKDLKTDADKLSPKPSTVFDSLHKLQSGTVITAAKAIDTAIAAKDASAAPAAQKKFNDAASKFFDNLGKAAAKESTAIKGKLSALVDATEKEALAACKSEVDAFVKSMTGLARSAEGAVDALKEHTDLCKRGVKEITEHYVEAQKALAKVRANRVKGEEGLEDSQKILHHLRIAESTIAQKGAFFKSQTPLEKEYSKALDNGSCPKDTVARLRKDDEAAHNEGLRIMAKARDIRGEIYDVVIEHQEEVKKVAELAAKNDRTRAGQLKRLDGDFKKFTPKSDEVLDKTDRPAWSKIENLTRSNDEKAYKTCVQETTEAFEALPGLITAIDKFAKLAKTFHQDICTDLAKGLTKDESKEAEKVVEDLGKFHHKITKLQQRIRNTGATQSAFKNSSRNATRSGRSAESRFERSSLTGQPFLAQEIRPPVRIPAAHGGCVTA